VEELFLVYPEDGDSKLLRNIGAYTVTSTIAISVSFNAFSGFVNLVVLIVTAVW
jgi:hypothetical protein